MSYMAIGRFSAPDFFMPYGGERLIYCVEIYCIRFRIVNYAIGAGNCTHEIGGAGALEQVVCSSLCAHLCKTEPVAVGRWIGRTCRICLESKLIYIVKRSALE